MAGRLSLIAYPEMGTGLLRTRGHRPDSTICQLLHDLDVGGAEVLAARLAVQLRHKYRFIFICLDRLGTLGEQLRADGFAVYVLNRQAGVDWRCALRLAKLLEHERVQIIQAHQYTPFFYALLARLIYQRPPVLFTEHGRHHPDFRRPKRILTNRLLLRGRDRVVSVGVAVKEALVSNEGIPPGRIRVIYNGIDLSPFDDGVALRETVRRELNLNAGDLVLIMVARLDYLKDHATAVRTFERLVRVRSDVSLLLVGDGPERSKIEQLAEQSGVASQVRFLGMRNDIRRLLAAADIFLLTSVSEGIPLTVIEAMAAGLPVVATRVGGLGEVVDDGVTGMLTPVGDPVALADRILELAGDAERRREMGDQGKARARALFAEEQMHAGYRKLYDEMLSV